MTKKQALQLFQERKVRRVTEQSSLYPYKNEYRNKLEESI